MRKSSRLPPPIFLLAALASLLTCVANAQPAGDYQQSCQRNVVQNNVLHSSCKDRRGDFHDTSLADVNQCVGNIFNNDGVLGCSRSLLPKGGYTASCEQVAVVGVDLHANCHTKSSGLNPTVLASYRHCVGDISNVDGVLRCNRDGPVPPAGDYANSCTQSWVEGTMLHSMCKVLAGFEIAASLDISGCRSQVVNLNGRLSCVTGTGPVPAGGYTRSCSDIVLTPTSITASCSDPRGGSVQSTITNRGACRTPIENIYGFLSCATGSTAPPNGSYIKTCRSVVSNGTSLSALCRNNSGSFAPTTLNIASCVGDISDKDGALSCLTAATQPPVPPVISVGPTNPPKSQMFLVTGSGFLHNHAVSIRVADDALNPNLFFPTTSKANGTIMTTLSIACRPGALHFSANDGREDPSDTTTLWSKAVAMNCQ